MNSDDNFAVYRRFGKLQARRLLHLQAELTDLEEKLDEMDVADKEDPALELLLHNREWAENSERGELFRKIFQKLNEYNTTLLQEHRLRSMPRPTPTNRKSVFDHIYQEKFLDEGEYNHIYHIEDMVAPGYYDSEDSWVKSSIQFLFQKSPKDL
ncbi:hypothetical protein FGG08_004397 [Glutinoglossum americanum]|uniref:DUF6594 domain-containing protein n=1 Tax=Glutinoglossum americanum TaxID=1670608 RepID=A0A9P8I0Q8_9PEZI|nr:hypothetical protein FGG08_004397 [Glutinoglossum americanum]